MAELVEQGVRLVEAEQARLACAAAREAHHVDDDRQDAAVELLLVAQRAHPGAAVLRVPREIVADEQRDRRAVRADRRPGARVGVRQSHVVARDEGDAEQAMGDVEGGGDHRLERQIGLELALVDVVERLAALLGVVAPVPRLELEIAALGGDHRLQRFRLAQRLRARRRPDATHQVERRFGVLAIESARRKAAKLGKPSRRARSARSATVSRMIAALSCAPPPAPRATKARNDLLAQVAPGRELQERLVGRARQRHRMLAGKPARGGRLRRGGDEALRQAGEIVGPVENQRERFFVGEHVLAEQRAEARQPLADRRQPRLLLGGEAGAGARERDAPAFERPRRLGIEAETAARLMQRLDAGEQRVVEQDRVALARQHRRDVAFDALDLVAGLALARWKNAALTRLSGAPARSRATIVLSKVGAAGSAMIAAISARLAPTPRRRRAEMLGPDAVERRRAERRVPRRKQGIVGRRRELIHAGELGAPAERFATAWSAPSAAGERPARLDDLPRVPAARIDFGAVPAQRLSSSSQETKLNVKTAMSPALCTFGLSSSKRAALILPRSFS